MENQIKFTEIQFDKIGHTLGINIYHCKHSCQKKDKFLPDEFYRNYYNYGRNKDENFEPEWITEISEFIDKWQESGLLYFQINEKGIEIFRKQFKEEITDTYVPLSKSKQRYQDYLHSDTGETFAEYLGIKRKHKK